MRVFYCMIMNFNLFDNKGKVIHNRVIMTIDNKEQYIDPKPKTCTRKNNVRYRPLPKGCSVEQPEILPEKCCKIQLTRGLFAIVDEDMVEDLNRFSWSAAPDGNTCYAIANDADDNTIRMHRHVLRINRGENVTIDHINGNGIDNRRENLRIVSRSENQLNRKHPRKSTKNRFRGVVPGLTKGWQTLLNINGKKTKKNFDNEVDAARYYDYMMFTYKGPKAKTNLSMGRFTPEEIASFNGVYSNPLDKSGVKPTEAEKERDTLASRVKLLEEILRLTEAELKSAQNSRRELADNVIGSQLSPQDK